MDATKPKSLHYKRSHFATQLPVRYLYSPSHYWLGRESDGRWKVGLTKFAVRMLGEMVDHGFEVEPSGRVALGQMIGWIEGFKAISDIFCVAEGTFQGGNPLLKDRIGVVNKDCYGEGWLYLVSGTPDTRCVEVEAYVQLLDKAIDRILEKQKDPEIH